MNKLEPFKGLVFDKIIRRLLRHPESDTSLTYLPEYMMAAERFSDLLEYMSAHYIDTLLSRAESLSIVRHNAQHGADAAFALERDPDLYRFALNLATLRETFGIHTIEREIEALVALDQLERALNLIHAVSIKEYRLYLLTVLARALKLQDKPIDETVTEQIRHLYNEVDIVSEQELAHQMAANLVLCFPDLAVDLVKRLGLNRRDESEDALNRALVALSLPTFGIDRADESQISTFRPLFLQGPLRWLAFETLARKPASELLAQINTVPNMTDRIFILSEWAAVNKEREDAIDVVRIALEWLISSTEVAPNASILRKLALPLIHSKTSSVIDLVKTFDTQLSTIQHIGPTEEIIKLQLILAETEAATDFHSARNRLVDIYLTIMEFDDIVLQATCLASMLATLTRVDPDKQLDVTDQLHTLVQQDLSNAVERILATTADHLRFMRPVIRTLAQTHPDWALSLAQSLNTQERRDAAIFECVRSHIELPADALDWDYILQCLTHIQDLRVRDSAKLYIVKELAHKDSLVLPPNAGALLEPDLYDEMDRCEFCCYAFTLLRRNNFPDEKVGKIEEALDISWRNIPSVMHRIEVGFRITSLLSTLSRQMANSYLNRTHELIHRGTDDHILFLCLKLAIRAYSGLLTQGLAEQNELEMLTDMINKVHTPVTKIILFNELAVRMYSKGRIDQCKRIVSSYLRPNLPSHKPASAFEAVCLYFGAPALYCAHQLTAFELIGHLPRPLRDQALFDICMLRLFSTPPDEPLDFFDVKARNLSYEDLVDLCRVLEQIEADYMIYGVIWHISEFLSSQEGKLRLSQQQRFAIADRLESLINKKLPHPDFIQHDGYKIVCLAEVARIRQANVQDWLDLVEMAKKMPNTSDKAYVLALIARALPNRQRERAKQLFQEARSLVDSIPNAYERLLRYQDIAAVALEFDPTLCREFLNAARDCLVAIDHMVPRRVQKRLIDLAYRVDPRFAASLASLSDDDPARQHLRETLRQEYETLQLRNRMMDGGELSTDSTQSSRDLARAAWALLAGLNANRITTIHLSQTRNYLKVASSFPLTRSFPMLAWFVENAVRRHEATPKAASVIRPLFMASLASAQVAYKLSLLTVDRHASLDRSVIGEESSVSEVIVPGDRERAFAFIRNWLIETCPKYLKISDPYFGPNDLEILKLIREVNPTCHVKILTSRKHHYQEHVQVPWEEAYMAAWRSISDQNPPPTDIIIVGIDSSGQSPVHDRWWISDRGGLRFGTSLNTIGLSAESEISVLTEDEAARREAQLDQYFNREKREHNGRRLIYVSITL